MLLSDRTLDALSDADDRLGPDTALRAVGDELTSEPAGARRLARARRFFDRLVERAPRLLALVVSDVLASEATPLAKARLACAALQSAPRDQTAALAALNGLERLHPRRRVRPAEAEALTALIEAAHETGRDDLARALGITLRDYLTPPTGGVAAAVIREARLDAMQTRIGLWRAGRLMSLLGRTEAAERACALYTARYPYHRDERERSLTCGSLLVLNARPLLRAETLAGVHNHCNIASLYPFLRRERPLALNVLMLDGLDFRRLCDEIEPPDAVLNNIADAETQERFACARRVREIADHFGAPLINPPEALAATAPDALWRRIGGRGRVVCPKTIRLAPELGVDGALARVAAAFDWPVSLRAAAASGSAAKAWIARNECEARAALVAMGFGAARGAAYATAADEPGERPGGEGRRFRLFRIGGSIAALHARAAGDARFELVPEMADCVPLETLAALDEAIAGTGLDACAVDFTLTPEGCAAIVGVDAAARGAGRDRAALESIGDMLERRAAGHRARIGEA